MPIRTLLPTLLVWGLLFARPLPVRADALIATEHSRTTIYHSPQTPGFTSWVGCWTMPDGSLMISFTQATGPIEGRPTAPQEVRDRLNWPPGPGPQYELYDMTGLDLRNVHLRSEDGGDTWNTVSADPFRSCLNGGFGQAQTALPDGTVIRSVNGFYLPYNPELPRTGFLQRSLDGTRTWGSPELMLDPQRYSAWARRLRILRDGRLVAALGVAPLPADNHTRHEYSSRVMPTLLVSSDDGRTWSDPLTVVVPDQATGWTEEYDLAELPSGDLLCVFRRQQDAHRWQSILKKNGDTWQPESARPAPLPHSGHPELLVTNEGPILHIATSGVHATDDAGETWTPLDIPGTAYYPKAVQLSDGRVIVVAHAGGDNAYGKVDQSIVMDRFRLSKN